MTKKQRDEKRAAEQIALLKKITEDAHKAAREDWPSRDIVVEK